MRRALLGLILAGCLALPQAAEACDWTSSGVGASAGAILGTFIFPGIGTFVGGVLGGGGTCAVRAFMQRNSVVVAENPASQ